MNKKKMPLAWQLRNYNQCLDISPLLENNYTKELHDLGTLPEMQYENVSPVNWLWR